ncbi:DNA polymerase/3'-5' exonuclease PolX [Evansella cellulosilytica]|uniref:DNA-directed DNA polymerase n=1 Tax=Evansella cellulosilytica (strain ATCC 21833 / DSM 2522 / FERM P-1141 / JCM 9156 / N-4) TaxID=649639 RepID=E6U0H6_EVAC2|nr:DNA polymerase/3'-5' exonuclease PolX [Evansella cellulosilytica]ADU31421.1 PHP domain protein [Evansella cellulosilytica DSM 2522]
MAVINKKDIIKSLEMIAVYLEIKGENSFKVSAYRKAANALERDERTINEIDDPSKLQGIGKGTASVINELMETGQSKLLNELVEELPSGLLPLLKLPGLGGKKIGKLYQELQVVDIDTLRKACEENRVQVLAGFGEKTEEKILAALKEFGKRPERLPIAQVIPVAELLKDRLKEMNDIERFELAGSFRRTRETVKDLDFIISTSKPEKVGEQIVSMENIHSVSGHGDTKISLELKFDDLIVSVDFRMIKDEAFITTLHHFTGSKDHNVLMRQRAKENGEKISEYGVENEETGKVLTFQSETDFFQHFGLHYIPPEVREGKGELEIFEGEFPLIHIDQIRSDLHMHTTWSDGADSIEEMIEACRNRKYDYMAITDHSQFLKVANGLSEERLKRQHEEIRKINDSMKDFTVLTGVEMDILPDGSLDYNDAVLQNIDFVIASIHSSFHQDKKTIMKRIRTAMENPHVAMIAHPTGRVIGRREGYPVDYEELIALAVETGTILELNANPNRLDLSAEWVKKAQDAGAKIAINTDAHRLSWLNHMEVGVNTGKRGWLKKESVVNTWSVEQLLQFINQNR